MGVRFCLDYLSYLGKMLRGFELRIFDIHLGRKCEFMVLWLLREPRVLAILATQGK